MIAAGSAGEPVANLPYDVIKIIVEYVCNAHHPRIIFTLAKTSRAFRKAILELFGRMPILRSPITVYTNATRDTVGIAHAKNSELWWVRQNHHYVIMCDNSACAEFYGCNFYAIARRHASLLYNEANKDAALATLRPEMSKPYTVFRYGVAITCDHSSLRPVSCAEIMNTQYYNVKDIPTIPAAKYDTTPTLIPHLNLWIEYGYNFVYEVDAILQINSFPPGYTHTVHNYIHVATGGLECNKIGTQRYIAYQQMLKRAEFVYQCCLGCPLEHGTLQMRKIRAFVKMCREIDDCSPAVES